MMMALLTLLLPLLLLLASSHCGMAAAIIPAHQHQQVIYRQPAGNLDLRQSAFPNPKPWPLPSRTSANVTNIVFWQRSIPNLELVTPTSWPLSQYTGMPSDIPPAQQSVTSAAAPFAGAQYLDGDLGLFLNTTGTTETLTTSTVESSFKECLPLWQEAGSALRVALDFAVPYAVHCERGVGSNKPCAIYSTLSVYVNSIDRRHFMWYETSLFDLDRPVLQDHVFFDASSQQPIVHGFVSSGKPSAPSSRYNRCDATSGSAAALNETTGARTTASFAYLIEAEHVNRAIADVASTFNVSGLPISASEWCVSGFNVEVEGTPDNAAGIRLRNIELAKVEGTTKT